MTAIYQQGQNFFDQGEFSEALAKFLMVYQGGNSNPQLLLYIALCQFEEGRPERALYYLNKFEQVRPNLTRPDAYRLSFNKALILFHLKEDEQARLLLEDVCNTFPEQPFSYLLLADYYFITNRYEKALENYEHFIQKAPQDREYGYANHRVAYIYERRQAFTTAVYYFIKALSSKEAGGPLYFNYAVALHALGKEDDAELFFARAKAYGIDSAEFGTGFTSGSAPAPVVPEHDTTELDAIRDLFRAGKWQQAIDYAMNNPPADHAMKARAYWLAGAAAMQIEKYTEAVAFFNQNENILKELNVNRPELLQLYRGTAYYNLNMANEATQDLENHLRTNPNDEEAAPMLVGLYMEKDQNQKALDLIKRFVNKNPDLGKPAGYLAIMENQNSNAIDLLNTYNRNKPNDSEALYNLGFAYQQDDQLDNAIDKYDQATKADPKFADAFYNQGVILVSEDKQNDALSKFEAALNADPKEAEAGFAAAQITADQGDRENTLKFLQTAFDRGFSDKNKVANSDALRPFANDPDFQKFFP
jgi:tetratricopeptide (TPR) repeat protein